MIISTRYWIINKVDILNISIKKIEILKCLKISIRKGLYQHTQSSLSDHLLSHNNLPKHQHTTTTMSTYSKATEKQSKCVAVAVLPASTEGYSWPEKHTAACAVFYEYLENATTKSIQFFRDDKPFVTTLYGVSVHDYVLVKADKVEIARFALHQLLFGNRRKKWDASKQEYVLMEWGFRDDQSFVNCPCGISPFKAIQTEFEERGYHLRLFSLGHMISARIWRTAEEADAFVKTLENVDDEGNRMHFWHRLRWGASTPQFPPRREVYVTHLTVSSASSTTTSSTAAQVRRPRARVSEASTSGTSTVPSSVEDVTVTVDE